MRISKYQTHRLRKQEIVKTRQHTAAISSMVTGAIGAIPTYGGTLVVSAYGARRYYVATKKLDLIQGELVKRGIQLHKLQKRDVLIPAVTAVIGVGAGMGLDEIAMSVTNTGLMGTVIDPGGSVAEALATNTGETLHAAAQGVHEQAHEMLHGVLDVNNGVPAAQDLESHTVWVPAQSAEEAAGYHAGMAAAQSAERGVVASGAALISDAVISRVTWRDPRETAC